MNEIISIINKGLQEIEKRAGIPASVLKIIAVVTMFIDHTGSLLFPDVAIFRIIGRLAFPIYAYLIGEGCLYTKSKWKYLRNISLTFIAFQIVYGIVSEETKMCVLLGFALFVVFTMIMDWARKDMNKRMMVPLLYSLFVGIMLTFFEADYLFFSFCAPMIPYFWKDNKILKLLLYFGLLFILGIVFKYQFYGLFAIIPLILYNGQKGNIKMKYMFYAFYPLHYLFLGILKIIFMT